MIYDVPIYAQGDPAWGDVILGNNRPGSPFTLRYFGCLLVCMSMMARDRPDSMNASGIRNGLFSWGGGDALTFDVKRWKASAPVRLIGASGRHAYDAMPTADIERFKAHTGPVILEVSYGHVLGKPNKFMQHFVLHVGWVTRGFGAAARQVSLIFDPERGGQIVELCPLYGPTLEVALCRMAYYETDQAIRALEMPVPMPETDPKQRQLLTQKGREVYSAPVTEP